MASESVEAASPMCRASGVTRHRPAAIQVDEELRVARRQTGCRAVRAALVTRVTGVVDLRIAELHAFDRGRQGSYDPEVLSGRLLTVVTPIVFRQNETSRHDRPGL